LNDLKGLGANDGPAVAYTWTPPSLLPQFLPWLAMLGLLLLKPNRTARAWWVWLPLVCVAASEAIARPLLDFIPSDVLIIFGQVFFSLGFGIAAVWLLATFLCHRLRFLVFLKMLGAASALSAFCYLVRQDWGGEPALAFGFLVLVGVCVLVAAIGLSLAGLICRRQYRPFGLTLWLAVFIAGLWLVVSAPFFIIAWVSSRGEAPWLEFVQTIVAFAALTFGMILPYLVLAFANGLFRERLKDLLHLHPASPPPVPVAPPPILNAGIQI
jgi:hypothetical protein